MSNLGQDLGGSIAEAEGAESIVFRMTVVVIACTNRVSTACIYFVDTIDTTYYCFTPTRQQEEERSYFV